MLKFVVGGYDLQKKGKTIALKNNPRSKVEILIIFALLAAVGAVAVSRLGAGTISIKDHISGVTEKDQRQRVNDHRSGHSLSSLRRAKCLTEAARHWSKTMHDEGRTYHDTDSRIRSRVQDYCGSGFDGFSESVGAFFTSGTIFTAMIASTSHHCNIDSHIRSECSGYSNRSHFAFNYIGVGAYVSNDGYIYVTHLYAKCTGSCVTSKWQNAPNDPPEPDLVSPADGNSYGPCTTSVTVTADAADSAQTVRLAIEYWGKDSSDSDSTYQRVGWATMNDTGGSWSNYVSGGTNRSARANVSGNSSDGRSYRWRAKSQDSSGFLSTKPTTDFRDLPDSNIEFTGYRTFVIEPDSTNPTKPGNFRQTAATTTTISLAWNASTDNCGLARYDLQRRDTATLAVTTLPISASAVSFVDVGLRPAGVYTYLLCAEDVNGRRTCSDLIVGITNVL